MRLNGNSRVLVWMGTCASVLCLLAGATSVKAAAPDELAKQIEGELSGIQRRIVTEPSRAEKEFLEVREQLKQLKEAAPNHAKLATPTKRAADLQAKLEKRLEHPVGGSANKEETKPAAGSKPKAPSDLPSSVVSRLKRLEDTLNAVVTALEKNQLQTAGTKLAQATKLMDEIQSRYGEKIPADNDQMKAAINRLSTIGSRYAQAKTSADAKGRRFSIRVDGRQCVASQPFFRTDWDIGENCISDRPLSPDGRCPEIQERQRP